MGNKPKIVAVMGPTATGKTDLAIDIAKNFASNLISVDSALVYKDMNIGTAKPDAATLAEFPHALVNTLSPEESYSAADFANDATLCIDKTLKQRRLPVLVGGTMLYYRALLNGIDDLPTANLAIRARLNAKLEQNGSQALHEKLQVVDAVSANRIHPNDSQRITRALEVFEVTGRALSEQQSNHEPENVYDCLKIVLLPKDRAFLHQRIETRFVQMLEHGFIKELGLLREKYNLHIDLPSMRSVGYRQAWQYLEGQYDYKTMQEKGIIATRQLAKRQHTWLRKEIDAHFFYLEDINKANILGLVDTFLSKKV